MRLPIITGIIRRRLLINYRLDPQVAKSLLPKPFAPKIFNGYALVGICLIRLEEIRPKGLPRFLGVSSENAAHRIAVTQEKSTGQQDSVFIVRRDTNSLINHIGGGRLFPGEHKLSEFEIQDDGNRVSLNIHSGDFYIRVEASSAETLPDDSIFRSIEQASEFFEKGSVGYSVTNNPVKVNGLELFTKNWKVSPLNVNRAESSYLMTTHTFPSESIEFDSGLIMRNVEHEWHSMPDLMVEWPANQP